MNAKPNLLIVTVDCMREDCLREEIAPNMSRLAGSGMRYTNAYSNGCGTPDSFPAIFASRTAHPFAHVEGADADQEYSLKGDDVLLAEALARQGYDTAGFVGGNPYLGKRYGYERGFGLYCDHQPVSLVDRITGSRLRGALRSMAKHVPWSPYAGAQQVTQAATDWLAGRSSQAPFFAWAHYMDVHFPTLPPGRRGVRERQAAWSPMTGRPAEHHDVLVGLYESAVGHVDACLAELLRAVPENTLVVLTADHGQLFGEHGSYWHNGVWEQLLRVPLVIAGPGIGAGEFREPVQLLDLSPHLTGLLGVEAPEAWRGDVLVEPATPIYAVSNNPGGRTYTEALICGSRKVVRTPGGEWEYCRDSEGVDMVLDEALKV